MEIRVDIVIMIAGAGLVTWLPRVLPLMVLTRLNLPEWLKDWLSFVPIAVMAALIAQSLFLSEGRWIPVADNPKLLAAIPAFLVAIRTKSLLLTVLAGVLALMLLQMLM